MGRFLLSVTFFVLALFAFSPSAFGIDIVTEKTPLPPGTCQEFEFYRSLNVYKDPALFLSDLNQVSNDHSRGWKQMQQENPVLTGLEGKVALIQLGPARPFKNFGAIARIYEAAEPRLKWTNNAALTRTAHGKLPKQSTAQVIPIQICGNGAYNSTLGFVLEDDFKKAQEYDTRRASLPPSVHVIPELPATDTGR